MKRINWPDLIKDVSEALVLTQQDFAKKVGSSQQSVSHWYNCLRPPSPEKQNKIIKMATKANINVDNYVLSGDTFKNLQVEMDYRELPLRWRRVTAKLVKLKNADRRQIIANLEYLVEAIEGKNKCGT
jgi:transcriptional regulator with XRE-family HTH domain